MVKIIGLMALAVVSAAEGRSLFDANLFVQLDLRDLTVENRAQRLSDMKAAGADALQLAFCEFFATGEARHVQLDKLADMITYFESAGYPVAVWVSSLGYGEPTNPDYQRRFPRRRKLKSLGGVEAVMCSTDGDYAAALAENVQDFIRAGAKFILWDDDFVQSCRPGLSCVCDEHLARYSKRVGRPVTAADVKDAFTGGPNELRTAFLDEMGASLLALAARMRAAADEIDPTVGMGLCASYTHYDLDGVDLERLVRTFKGRHQPRSFLRASGAPYWVADRWKPEWRKLTGLRLGGVLEFVRSQVARFRETDIRFIDENDPYPRRREVVPPGLCELYDKVLMAEGGIVRNKYMLRYGSDRVDTSYLEAHLANLPRDAEIVRLFAETRSIGFRVYGPEGTLRRATLPRTFGGEHDVKAFSAFPTAGVFLSQNGVPTQYDRDDTPVAAFGPAVLNVPRAAYSRGVFVDLEAAEELMRQGVDVGYREGADFWLHENAEGGRFAVLGLNHREIAYGEGVGGFGRRLWLRLCGEAVPTEVTDVPFEAIWEFFTGERLPFRLMKPQGVCSLVRERKDGSKVALFANPQEEDSEPLAICIDGREMARDVLPAWNFAVMSFQGKAKER